MKISFLECAKQVVHLAFSRPSQKFCQKEGGVMWVVAVVVVVWYAGVRLQRSESVEERLSEVEGVDQRKCKAERLPSAEV